MSLARQKFGEPHAMARKKVFDFMPEMVQDFVRQAPFAVLARAFSRLWDVEQIAETREQEPNRYWLQRFMDSIDMGRP